jgi:hypothetical protein
VSCFYCYLSFSCGCQPSFNSQLNGSQKKVNQLLNTERVDVPEGEDCYDSGKIFREGGFTTWDEVVAAAHLEQDGNDKIDASSTISFPQKFSNINLEEHQLLVLWPGHEKCGRERVGDYDEEEGLADVL